MSKFVDFPYFKLWFIFERLVDYVSDRDIVWTDFDELEWSQQHTLINAIITLGEELGVEVTTKFALLPDDDNHRHPGIRMIWSDSEKNGFFYVTGHSKASDFLPLDPTSMDYLQTSLSIPLGSVQ